MDELIDKYLNGELDTEEEALLDSWLAESKQNQQLLYQIESLQKHSPEDIERSKNKVKGRISYITEELGGHREWLWLKAAAVLIFGLFIGVLISYMRDAEKPSETLGKAKFIEKFSLPGQKITLTLPDGSKVKMNSGSKLIVPERFEGKYREVELSGEAFFDVSRDEKHPFIIHTGDMSIRVLGTSFNVRAYPEEINYKVAVAHGKVAVTGSTNQSLILEKDEMAVYDHSSGHSFKSTFDAKKEFSWKDKILHFENANIGEIISALENWYGVEFSIKTDLDNKKDFSGEYHNKSLETVLGGLSYVYEFSYEIKDNQVLIMKKK